MTWLDEALAYISALLAVMMTGAVLTAAVLDERCRADKAWKAAVMMVAKL